MKKITYLLIAVFAISLSSCSLFKNNKPFEGYIKYTIDYEGDIDEGTLAQMPTSTKEYYKDHKVRKVNETAMGGIYTITDNANMEIIMLLDLGMMGQKLAVKQDSADLKEAFEEIGDIEVNPTGETKEILGYTAKKVEIEVEDNIFTAYTTTEITSPANAHLADQFKNVEGVILEYSVTQRGITSTYTATEIEKEKVDDAMFTIPEDYELKTQEEISTMFGG
jgi:hypothetical protein